MPLECPEKRALESARETAARGGFLASVSCCEAQARALHGAQAIAVALESLLRRGFGDGAGSACLAMYFQKGATRESIAFGRGSCSRQFQSLFVDFPALLAEFCGKRFALIWRGSPGGLRAHKLYRPTLADLGQGKHFRGHGQCLMR
jgi:hypothetical protein